MLSNPKTISLKSNKNLSYNENRFCLINPKHTTRINKNGKQHWLKYRDGWICNKCYMKLIGNVRNANNNFVEFIYCACNCGFTRPKYDKQGQVRRFIKGHLPNKGEYTDSQGYRHIPIPRNSLIRKRDHRFRAHRIIFEEYYKCCLLRWGAVHHKNEIRDDNRIENLEGMTNSKHKKLHMIGKKIAVKDMSNRICFKCSTTQTYINKRGHQKWFSFGSNCFICRTCYRKLLSFIKKFDLNLIGPRSIKKELTN